MVEGVRNMNIDEINLKFKDCELKEVKITKERGMNKDDAIKYANAIQLITNIDLLVIK